MKYLETTIELIEEMLGTTNSDPKIHEKFIASKAPDAKSREEEVAAFGVDAVVQNGKTILPKDENGEPFVWDYQIKGFFKAACAALQRMKGESCAKESNKIRAYKKVIDTNIFVYPRRIKVSLPEGGVIGDCQRPLRAQTPQGERVSIADSETVPEGSQMTFTIKVPDVYEKAVKEWLAYGEDYGLGQWRNSGKGRFEVLSIEEQKYSK